MMTIELTNDEFLLLNEALIGQAREARHRAKMLAASSYGSYHPNQDLADAHTEAAATFDKLRVKLEDQI